MKSTLKAIGKILLTVFLILYLGVEIIVTACLVNFNDQRITEFGNQSWLIMDEDLGEYKKGDLVIVTKESGDEVSKGDNIFFYDIATDYTVNYAEVSDAYPSGENSYTFILPDNYNVNYEYYIGKNVKVYKGIGTALSVLESKWGFLLLIILPTMIAIIFEFYLIILEIVDLRKES